MGKKLTAIVLGIFVIIALSGCSQLFWLPAPADNWTNTTTAPGNVQSEETAPEPVNNAADSAACSGYNQAVQAWNSVLPTFDTSNSETYREQLAGAIQAFASSFESASYHARNSRLVKTMESLNRYLRDPQVLSGNGDQNEWALKTKAVGDSCDALNQ
jgi:hypothetical protein